MVVTRSRRLPAGKGEVEWQRELAAGTIEPVLNYYTDFLSYDDPDKCCITLPFFFWCLKQPKSRHRDADDLLAHVKSIACLLHLPSI